MRSARRKFLILLLPVLLLPLATPVYAAASTTLSSKAEHVVKRNGSPIGTLKIDFNIDGNSMVATSHYSVKVELMAIVLYRYHKRMTEEYEGGRLIAYEADIDDYGTKIPGTRYAQHRCSGDRSPKGYPVGTAQPAPIHLLATGHR